MNQETALWELRRWTSTEGDKIVYTGELRDRVSLDTIASILNKYLETEGYIFHAELSGSPMMGASNENG